MASQIWTLGADFLLGSGLTSAGALNVIAAALMLFLAVSRERRTHMAGLLVAWALFLVASVLRSTGLI